MVIPPMSQEEAIQKVISIVTAIDDPNAALSVLVSSMAAMIASVEGDSNQLIDAISAHLKSMVEKLIAKGAELAQQDKRIITLS